MTSSAKHQGETAELPAPAPRNRRWSPEASDETAMVLRTLAVRPWLVPERDAEAMAAVRRNLSAVRDALSRLGWVLVVERDLIRLRKSPPTRRDAWIVDGPTPQQASWFLLLTAGAETVAPHVSLSHLVMAARAAAAEAGLPVANDITERRAIVRALRMLHDRGVIIQVDGDLDGFVQDEEAPVLMAVHHSRLAHVIANFGPGDPVNDPEGWLEGVEHEPDAARRMRRRLVDDAIVYSADLDVAEADWLSRRVRGDDGVPLAAAFGLHLERRSEGAAFVLSEDAFRHPHELGPTPFPAPGTIPHAALLLCDHAAKVGSLLAEGGPGPGWRALDEEDVLEHLAQLAGNPASGSWGWRRDLVEEPRQLGHQIRALLSSLDLVRPSTGSTRSSTWWFSPATARWVTPDTRPPAKRRGDDRAGPSSGGTE